MENFCHGYWEKFYGDIAYEKDVCDQPWQEAF